MKKAKAASRLCVGGPYAGDFMQTRLGQGACTIVFSAKGFRGRYVLKEATLRWEDAPTSGMSQS